MLEAAGTKWNFLPFRPGLVGGHCIGVDPYYLTHKAEEIGYHPQIILAGRRLNDGMGSYVASQLVKKMLQGRIPVGGAKVLILGFAFKENCPDIRNTRIIDVVNELKAYNCDVEVYDPWVSPDEARHEYGIELIEAPQAGGYDATSSPSGTTASPRSGGGDPGLWKPSHVLYDLKNMLRPDQSDLRL